MSRLTAHPVEWYFGVDVRGWVTADMGASAGGFTRLPPPAMWEGVE
jgi:hypothetical protein